MRWNRDPSWYYTLDPKTRIDLIAEYRLANENEKQQKKRQERIKSDKLKKMIQQHRSQNE